MRTGFTLIEMLVVLAIMVSVFGMVGGSFAKRNLRMQSVQVAANELAATFRAARTRALETRACHAVVFNIQNDPASTGRVLNNRTGGHWYRILGPSGMDRIPAPSGSTLSVFQASVNACWYDEVHVLPARKVRFVALTDMDWGDYNNAVNSGWTGRQKSATVSFPRPWFGWWDSSSKRLYPWGGYDPAIMASGFYFWGNTTAPTWGPLDPEPISSATGLPPGCTNKADRWLDRFEATNPAPTSPISLSSDQLWAAGSPRPLLNAEWLDAALVFLGNGMVRMNDWMPGRDFQTYTYTTYKRGIGERGNQVSVGSALQRTRAEVGNFDQDSGGWFITLGPDALDDNDIFPTAKAAMDSLMPLYRVFVSSFGEIRVIQVSPNAKFGGLSAFPTSEAWWRTGNNVTNYFGQDRYNTGTVKMSDNYTGIGAYQGRPITDFLVPDMLTNRSVWMK